MLILADARNACLSSRNRFGWFAARLIHGWIGARSHRKSQHGSGKRASESGFSLVSQVQPITKRKGAEARAQPMLRSAHRGG